MSGNLPGVGGDSANRIYQNSVRSEKDFGPKIGGANEGLLPKTLPKPSDSDVSGPISTQWKELKEPSLPFLKGLNTPDAILNALKHSQDLSFGKNLQTLRK